MHEALLHKPARDLKPQEAFDLLMHHVEQGHINTVQPARVNEKGKSITHFVGQNIAIHPHMAGVHYAHVSGDGRVMTPKPEFAVMLYRMAVWLSEECDVTKIVWGGIGAGSGKNAIDCHTDGRCIDFYAAETAGGRYFDVLENWYRLPVTLKGQPKFHDKAGDDHWGDDKKTYYRLATSVQPLFFWPGWFFGKVYEFAMKESTVSNSDISADAFQRGEPLKAGAIFHPDHPVAGTWGPNAIPGRRNHLQHMHFGVGRAIG